MKTWAMERFVVGVVGRCAVAVQGLIDVFTHRPGFRDFDLLHPSPGCLDVLECREYGCAGNCSESQEAAEYVAPTVAVPNDPQVPAWCVNCGRGIRYSPVLSEFVHWCSDEVLCPESSASGLTTDGAESPEEVELYPPTTTPSSGVGGEGADHPPSPSFGDIASAVHGILADHRFLDTFQCACDGRTLDSSYDWRRHVSGLIAEAVQQ